MKKEMELLQITCKCIYEGLECSFVSSKNKFKMKLKRGKKY